MAPSPLARNAGSAASAVPFVILTLETAQLFDNYVIESLADDEIAIEVASDDLTKALKSSSSASAVVVKLTKRNDLPCLSIGCSHVVRLIISR